MHSGCLANFQFILSVPGSSVLALPFIAICYRQVSIDISAIFTSWAMVRRISAGSVSITLHYILLLLTWAATKVILVTAPGKKAPKLDSIPSPLITTLHPASAPRVEYYRFFPSQEPEEPT
jgi:hypothetical protein